MIFRNEAIKNMNEQKGRGDGGGGRNKWVTIRTIIISSDDMHWFWKRVFGWNAVQRWCRSWVGACWQECQCTQQWCQGRRTASVKIRPAPRNIPCQRWPPGWQTGTSCQYLHAGLARASPPRNFFSLPRRMKMQRHGRAKPEGWLQK